MILIGGEIVKAKDEPRKTMFIYRWVLDEFDTCTVLEDIIYTKQDGVHINHRIGWRTEELELASPEEKEEFLKAIDQAGLVYYNYHYHAKPDKEDEDILRTMNVLGYHRWTEVMDLIKQCHGTYAKERLHDFCSHGNHLEEARNGDI